MPRILPTLQKQGTEVMPREVIEAVFRFLERTAIPTLDITGGAPELPPTSATSSRARPPWART